MSSGILLDATPLAGGHGVRGIGRYVRGLIDGLGTGDEWPARVKILTYRDDPVGVPAERAPALAAWRHQDVGWLTGLLNGVAFGRGRWFHATDPWKPWPPLGNALGIITVYDLIPLRDAEVMRRLRRHRRVVYQAYLRQVRRARIVMSISNATAVDLSELLGVSPTRIVVVPPVIRRAAAPLVDREQHAFIWVGVPDPHKRPDLAIRALAAYRQSKLAGTLTCFGPGSRAQYDELRALAIRHGVAEYVDVRGSVTDEQLRRAYASATALLQTSRYEGFGLPAMEAVLAGCPVIAVETPIARETLAGLATFTPAEAADMARAMSSPQPPPKTAQDDAEERHSPEAVGRALRTLYDRLE